MTLVLDHRICPPSLRFYDKMNDLYILLPRYLRIIDLIYRESILRDYLLLHRHDTSSLHNIIEKSMQDQYLLHQQVWQPRLLHRVYSFAIGPLPSHAQQKTKSASETQEMIWKCHNDTITNEIKTIKSPPLPQRENLLPYTVTAFPPNDPPAPPEVTVANGPTP